MKERQEWIDYLRSFIILTVVIHHAALSYTTFAHFNQEAYILSSHPMVDARRWIGFDILVCFNDIFFMSLMFLISGFFVISSLKKKGTRVYIAGRSRRLFVPFIFGVTVLSLLAYYPSYIYAHKDPNLFRHIADFFTVEYWPPGPPWFLGLLFIFNLLLIWIYPSVKPLFERIGGLLASQANKPILLIIYLFLITWILYVPMRLVFGPDGWTSLGPFDFQISRIFLYFGYFTIGTLVGSIPFDKGVLSGKSNFMRLWPLFIVLSISAFYILWQIGQPLEKLVQRGTVSNFFSNLIYSSIFVASCILSCTAYLTTAKAVFRRKNKFWDLISRHAFTVYLIHYVFIIWGQYMLLDLVMPAMLKFLIVALCSVLLSFLISYYLHKSRVIGRYL